MSAVLYNGVWLLPNEERMGWDQQEKGEKAESELRRASPVAIPAPLG